MNGASTGMSTRKPARLPVGQGLALDMPLLAP